LGKAKAHKSLQRPRATQTIDVRNWEEGANDTHYSCGLRTWDRNGRRDSDFVKRKGMRFEPCSRIFRGEQKRQAASGLIAAALGTRKTRS